MRRLYTAGRGGRTITTTKTRTFCRPSTLHVDYRAAAGDCGLDARLAGGAATPNYVRPESLSAFRRICLY